ncbi:hypothetical protein SARC_01179 [Sphaeroforma arctica JP610]|uniref:Uncharacterized protein n=1 Tax=Sphaeroforma arctica JP610 TaxID=667725 RepID=A0A0L0GEK3_9EUKA|nr:hypothetical protein SARC_01179 [Sphaeroforma arctica JP610]KNC86673.1 hypothetical protein SARC_01179 [Sphaeroforma arctica JP610]|eukprot:XP_014160575.1 hypothetical protein SARC_01179 [Sphaeroforma arctica JP610]
MAQIPATEMVHDETYDCHVWLTQYSTVRALAARNILVDENKRASIAASIGMPLRPFLRRPVIAIGASEPETFDSKKYPDFYGSMPYQSFSDLLNCQYEKGARTLAILNEDSIISSGRLVKRIDTYLENNPDKEWVVIFNQTGALLPSVPDPDTTPNSTNDIQVSMNPDRSQYAAFVEDIYSAQDLVNPHDTSPDVFIFTSSAMGNITRSLEYLSESRFGPDVFIIGEVGTADTYLTGLAAQ